jgi:putative two-component system response regulator
MTGLLISVVNALVGGRLEREARERHDEETIRRLAAAIELRSRETAHHVERMSRYCELLARRLGLGDERARQVGLAAALHDIGKLAVPDRILHKPGALTPAERAEMQRHAALGRGMLSGSSSPLLDLAARIAWTHHERFDGHGYPRGLSGCAIPLEGRLASVADVFDALTSDRGYRPALGWEQALAVMAEGWGSQFDPVVLHAFFDALDEVCEIDGAGASSFDLTAAPS